MLQSKEGVLSAVSTIFCILLSLAITTNASPLNMTALFVFGDSTVDPGNNNFFPTGNRGDHLPYGRDLPDHKPSGRFTNGKLATDFLASSLGLKELLPPFLDPTLSEGDIASGVSFASAGMGLDQITCLRLNVLNMSTQLDNFDQAMGRIQSKFGSQRASEIVSNAVFLVSAGSNDMVVNMYDLWTRRLEYSIPEYQDFLLDKVKSVIERLYNAGARKIAIVGSPPIGCLPVQITLYLKFPRSCVDGQNSDSRGYNSKLNDLLSTLRSNYTNDTKLIYLDIYTPILEMINQPATYGFDVTLKGCCGTGLYEAGGSCKASSQTCPDASKYIFFDAEHPSEAGYKHIAETMYNTLVQMLA